MRRRYALSVTVWSAAIWAASPAAAASYRTSGPYDEWLAEFEREALEQGVSPLHRGNAPPPLPFTDIKTLQTSLARAGYAQWTGKTPAGGQSNAGEIQLTRGFLSHRRTSGADAGAH